MTYLIRMAGFLCLAFLFVGGANSYANPSEITLKLTGVPREIEITAKWEDSGMKVTCSGGQLDHPREFMFRQWEIVNNSFPKPSSSSFEIVQFLMDRYKSALREESYLVPIFQVVRDYIPDYFTVVEGVLVPKKMKIQSSETLDHFMVRFSDPDTNKFLGVAKYFKASRRTMWEQPTGPECSRYDFSDWIQM